MKNGSKPKVAVIVPNYNNAATLRKSLEAVKTETERLGWELIVVDDSSADDSVEIARSCGAKVIESERNLGVSAARNIGVKATTADYLIFVDADIVPQPGALEAMVDTLRSCPEIQAVGAYPIPGDLSPEWSAHFVGLRSEWAYHWDEGEEERAFSSIQSECGAMLRSAFETLDGFSERHGGVGMEEFHMAHEMERRKLGHILIRVASYQHHYKTLKRRCFTLFDRTSRWVPLLLRRKKFETRKGGVGSIDAAISCFLTWSAFGALIGGLFAPGLLIAAGAAWLIQFLMELSFLRFARRMYGWPMVFYALPALQVMHVAIGLGFLWGLIKLPFTERKYFSGGKR